MVTQILLTNDIFSCLAFGWHDMLKGHQMGSVLISLFGVRFALPLILRLYRYVTVQLRGLFRQDLK